MDNHRIDIGDIQPRLYDRRRHQHINLPIDKLKHNLLKLMLLHLAMCIRHICLRHQMGNLTGDILNIADTVVYIIHLSLSGQLPHNRLPHHLLVVLHDVGLYRLALAGRFLQHTHIADSHKAHVQRPWDWRRSQRQHIHIVLDLLDLLLVAHAKALLLVDHKQSQIFVNHIC